MLVKSPGFTAVAVLTLAIGISANIAMFSVVNAVLLRPLPFEGPDRLVVVQQRGKQQGWTTGWSYPDFLDWREQNPVFEGFAAYTRAQFDLTDGEGASKVEGAIVSGGFFSMLKISAGLGRVLTEADELGGSDPVAVISHELWRRRFAQDQAVLGRTITLHDKVYTIVGVLPRGFRYPESLGEAQVWTVLRCTADREQWMNRHNCWLAAAGRLKPGLSTDQAQPLLNEMHRRLTQAHGTAESEVLVHGLRDMVVQGVRTTLWVLSAVVGFILLIVCANVANLCLTRASSRDREMAIRGALGADKLRLFAQCLTESVLLSLAGGIAGVIVAVWMVTLFRVGIAEFVPLSDSIRILPRELLFGLGVSLLVGVFLGVAPFWIMQRSAAAHVLMERRGASRRHAMLSNAIIGAQIAAALVLSIGTVLMIRSMMRLSAMNAGFNPENLITFNVGVRRMNEQQRRQFSRDFLVRLGALPSVTGVSTDSSMPCEPRGSSAPVSVQGWTAPDGKPIRACLHNVGKSYFKTLQIPLRKGRDISPAEHEQKARVVVITECLAGVFWPDADPIGRQLTCCGKSYEIIGVAADVVQGNVRTDKPNHAFFPFDTLFPSSDLRVVVRAQGDGAFVLGQIRAILKGVDETLPLHNVSAFKAQMHECINQERFTTTFLAVFASIALLLIVIGLYGVVSYAVAQRTREIGVRMALGAPRTSIVKMILRQGLVLSIAGSVVGIAGAICLTRFLSSYLFGVSATDPVTYAVVPVLITALAVGACLLPAFRAARVDPMVALRQE
jgi:putative ABC transport system permease protein